MGFFEGIDSSEVPTALKENIQFSMSEENIQLWNQLKQTEPSIPEKNPNIWFIILRIFGDFSRQFAAETEVFYSFLTKQKVETSCLNHRIAKKITDCASKIEQKSVFLQVHLVQYSVHFVHFFLFRFCSVCLFRFQFHSVFFFFFFLVVNMIQSCSLW